MDTQDNEQQIDDVIIEPEQEIKSSFGNASEESQVKKLKKKLKEAEQKAKENLDGWQRLKADAANSKKEESERLSRSRERGVEQVLESLLPALDSFDSAMQGSAWESIDSAWRQGMEFVHSQLIGALEQHGVHAFGTVGDAFDTASHEAAEHQATEGGAEVVQQVLRRGYKSSAGVIRPARVVVGDFAE